MDEAGRVMSNGTLQPIEIKYLFKRLLGFCDISFFSKFDIFPIKNQWTNIPTSPMLT